MTMIPSTYFASQVDVVKASAAVSPRGQDQWELAIQVPWQKPEYTVKGWCDRTPEDPQTGPMGQHRSLFYVQALREGKDGSAPWDYNYRLSVLDYDGPDAEAPPSMGGMPPIPTGSYTPQERPTATQQSALAQSPNNWDRRDISIKWGQAVNLAAEYLESSDTGTETWINWVKETAEEIFPLLIEWEKEAVDGYFADAGKIDFAKLNEETQREQELQSQELPGQPSGPEWDAYVLAMEKKAEQVSGEPLPTQTQPQLAADDADKLGWDGNGEWPPGPPIQQDAQNTWSYQDFMGKAIGLKVGPKALEKAFPMVDGMTTEACVTQWCMDNGKGFDDAFTHLKTSVATV